MRIGMKATDCPNRDEHTEGPNSYQGWHVWAEQKGKTHTQKRCGGCGLFAVWVPKVDALGITTKDDA